MKKLDLHIHTVATVSDRHFDFSLKKMLEYVTVMHLDCIAITNHNVFDKAQFDTIRAALAIEVLPGIEIDLEGGHILLISDGIDLNDFAMKCSIVHQQNASVRDSLKVETLKEIYPDLSKYLLIPHYDKRPAIRPEVIFKLKDFISAGEVTSIRKFKSCIKEKGDLVPVIFSDIRPAEELEAMPVRQTFVDLQDLTFSGIKSCLNDKAKVFLSTRKETKFFRRRAAA